MDDHTTETCEYCDHLRWGNEAVPGHVACMQNLMRPLTGSANAAPLTREVEGILWIKANVALYEEKCYAFTREERVAPIPGTRNGNYLRPGKNYAKGRRVTGAKVA